MPLSILPSSMKSLIDDSEPGCRISRVDFASFSSSLSLNLSDTLEWTGETNMKIPSGTLIFGISNNSYQTHAYRFFNIKGDGQCSARALTISLDPSSMVMIPRNSDGVPLSQKSKDEENKKMQHQMEQ
jgi:hypothetical protein